MHFEYQKFVVLNMKKIAVYAAVLLISNNLAAQNKLQSTKWIGTGNIPNPTEVSLEFGASDTLAIKAGDEEVEVMRYSVNADTLSISKLYGSSPCDSEVGKYHFSIKEDRILLVAVQDECSIRAQAFSTEGYIRKKD
jgi:hypothetical protein